MLRNSDEGLIKQFPSKMFFRRFRFVFSLTVLVCSLGHASILSAQSFEVTPIGGYRFGGDFFELLAKRPLDIDGAPAVGVVVDVPLRNNFQIEALFTHQHADAIVPTFPSGTPVNWQFAVDHWQGGAIQEYDYGRMRPFLAGTLGLTRYGADASNELRFTLGAGGGVKLFPSRHVGVRLDARTFMTFADADVRFFACSTLGSNQGCVVGFNANIVWQIEFTAGLIVKIN